MDPSKYKSVLPHVYQFTSTKVDILGGLSKQITISCVLIYIYIYALNFAQSTKKSYDKKPSTERWT